MAEILNLAFHFQVLLERFFTNNKFPIYRQYDKMDCGPTCLRMITAFYGRAYSQDEMMEKCKVERDGTSIYSLAECGRHEYKYRHSGLAPFIACREQRDGSTFMAHPFLQGGHVIAYFL